MTIEWNIYINQLWIVCAYYVVFACVCLLNKRASISKAKQGKSTVSFYGHNFNSSRFNLQSISKFNTAARSSTRSSTFSQVDCAKCKIYISVRFFMQSTHFDSKANSSFKWFVSNAIALLIKWEEKKYALNVYHSVPRVFFVEQSDNVPNGEIWSKLNALLS